MEKIVLLVIASSFTCIFSQSYEWQEDNPYNLSIAQQVQFINDSTGWILPLYDDFALFKTSDGGKNWSYLRTIEGICWQKPFIFIDKDTGYCVEAHLSLSFDKILKSTNGGFEWNEAYVFPYFGFVKNWFFINGSIGWLHFQRTAPGQQEIF